MEQEGTLAPMLGIPVFTGTEDEALAAAVARIGGADPAPLMTVAAWTLIHARDNPRFLEALRACRMVLPDGWPVVLLVRMMGRTASARVAGADMVPRLAAWCKTASRRMVLYGSGPGVAQAAAEKLTTATPGLDVVGLTPPMQEQFSREDGARIAADLKALDPAVVVVGISVPKGELLVQELAPHLPGILLIGVGGSLDNIAGTRRRAPSFVRRLYLEWMWRAVQNPEDKAAKGASILLKWPAFSARVLRETKRAASR